MGGVPIQIDPVQPLGDLKGHGRITFARNVDIQDSVALDGVQDARLTRGPQNRRMAGLKREMTLMLPEVKVILLS